MNSDLYDMKASVVPESSPHWISRGLHPGRGEEFGAEEQDLSELYSVCVLLSNAPLIGENRWGITSQDAWRGRRSTILRRARRQPK